MNSSHDVHVDVTDVGPTEGAFWMTVTAMSTRPRTSRYQERHHR